MSGSNLTQFPYIAENSLATPGLWNSVFSILSANDAALNSPSVLSGGISLGTQGLTINVDSTKTDYIFFNDTANQRSSYVIGSFDTNTADGLNIFDASGQTMIVSFSKQSVRFFQNVVGPVFDVGGALASTYNAATFIGSGSSLSGIQAAISAASNAGISRVYVPASMYPYNAAVISFATTVQMVREGGNWAVYDVKAYGAYGDNVHDDTAAIVSAISGLPTAGGVVYLPNGSFRVSATINLSNSSTSRKAITLQGAGIQASQIISTVTTGPAMIYTDTGNTNVLADFDLWGSANTIPGFISGNYGMMNVGNNASFCRISNVRVFYFGDIGVLLQGGQGPFTFRDLQVQSCSSWGIHLTPFSGVVPEEVQIVGGNIHTCAGGIRVQGVQNLGLFDIDIELGTNGTLPPVQLDGGAAGCFFGGVTASIQTVPSPAAIVYISSGQGNVFAGGYFTTGATNVDNIRLDTSNAHNNVFLGGHHVNTGGGSYASITNGHHNIFANPNLLSFAAGKDQISGTGYNFAVNVKTAAVSDSSTVVVEGALSVGTGTALFPTINYAVGSEVSLGFYRSGTSHIGLSYGGFSHPDGATTLPSITFSSESSLGFYRSGTSHVGLSYGGLSHPDGTALLPAITFSSESSLGLFRSANSVLKMSYGTLAVSGLSVTAPSLMRPTGAGLIMQEDGSGNVGSLFRFLDNGGSTWWALGMSGAAGSNASDFFITSFNQSAWSNVLRINVNGQLLPLGGGATRPMYAYSSESSLGWYRSGVSTMALSYGTLNLAAGAVNLSMTTLAAATSAVDSGLAIVMRASGLSLIYKSGGTIYVLAASTTSGTA